MFTIQGVCDWCNKSTLVTRHEYIDGKCYFACAECNEHAKQDVRQFNLEEQELRKRHPTHQAA